MSNATSLQFSKFVRKSAAQINLRIVNHFFPTRGHFDIEDTIKDLLDNLVEFQLLSEKQRNEVFSRLRSDADAEAVEL